MFRIASGMTSRGFTAAGTGLDLAYLQHWAAVLGIGALLQRALDEAGLCQACKSEGKPCIVLTHRVWIWRANLRATPQDHTAQSCKTVKTPALGAAGWTLRGRAAASGWSLVSGTDHRTKRAPLEIFYAHGYMTLAEATGLYSASAGNSIPDRHSS